MCGWSVLAVVAGAVAVGAAVAVAGEEEGAVAGKQGAVVVAGHEEEEGAGGLLLVAGPCLLGLFVDWLLLPLLCSPLVRPRQR